MRGLRRSIPTTCASLAVAGAEIRGWIEATPFPAALETAIRVAFAQLTPGQSRRVVRGALVGHGRGPARRQLCGPAGDLPQCARHRRGAGEDEGGVRVALQRSRDQLPRAQGLCACRRGALGRRAAHGSLRSWRGGRDVHDRHRERLRGRGVHHLELRTRRDGGAGRGEPGRVLCPQARAARGQAADHSPQSGLEAGQDGVRVGGREGQQRQAREDSRHCARTAQSLFAHRCRRRRTGDLRVDHRAALRPGDGHRVGQGRRRRQALHPASTTGDGEEPGPRARSSSATS